MIRLRSLLAGAALCTASACGTSAAHVTPHQGAAAKSTAARSAVGQAWPAAQQAAAQRAVPGGAPAHVVVVVEENHSAADVLGNPAAPFMNALARSGTSLTNFFAITHPSEPNYVALFSGSTHGRRDDSCPHRYRGANLGSQLRAARLTFTGYSDGLPSTGYNGCSAGQYARKHAPWTDFANLPRSVNKPLTALPRDFTKLPTVSFVIPNLDHDMHDGTIAEADSWLRRNLGRYARWARTHNSALIVTWDEDDRSAGNRIATFAVGAHVPRAATVTRRSDHYGLLRTIESWYHLRPLGHSAHRARIAGLWRA